MFDKLFPKIHEGYVVDWNWTFVAECCRCVLNVDVVAGAVVFNVLVAVDMIIDIHLPTVDCIVCTNRSPIDSIWVNQLLN